MNKRIQKIEYRFAVIYICVSKEIIKLKDASLAGCQLKKKTYATKKPMQLIDIRQQLD